MLPTLVRADVPRPIAPRSRASGAIPHDLAALVDAEAERVAGPSLAVDTGAGPTSDDRRHARLGAARRRRPDAVVDALVDAAAAGATAEQLGRAVAFAAALRIVRFHTQNDHGDWNIVHHAFTTANALHQALVRHPTPELLRGVVPRRLRVYLDRFLNVPAARLPQADDRRPRRARRRAGTSRARSTGPGAIVAGYLRGGGDRAGAGRRSGHGAARRGRRLPLVPGGRGGRAPARPGRPARRSRPSCSSAWPASWPPTRRPGASCRPWCASPPACAGAKPLYDDPDVA